MSQDHVLRNTAVTENSVLNLVITIIDCLHVCEIRIWYANGTVIYIELGK